ncbi:MAG: imidazole glycerol phosphate synthase subunit HisH [Nitrospinae bacterium CG11_big_fil_rev_8_21_14_0_20_56_8]|nr:MAG: imidazole glycerol phosphate synthase subunit HisH [Nitrospinae bacterium CG11_big_fil_rev_8_21_14_0_20_56_8]
MIAVVDYGMGNLRSVQKALERVGAEAVVTSDPARILNARSVVLPGVGAFRDCMANLEKLNLLEVVRKSIEKGKPFLGICLGLQVLFDQSEEFGRVPGLGILPGEVRRFPDNLRPNGNGFPLKIPHMGWNTVSLRKPNSLFEGVPDQSYFYFVHSYYVLPRNPDMIATTTDYGIEFVSGIQHENIFAFQFHPEKSQKLGLALLERFARLQ